MRTTLVKEKGTSLHPVDDRCVAGEHFLSTSMEDEWRFKVEILAVK